MLIVDTGVLVAATDRSDPHHRACAALLTRETEPLVTTGLVIAETGYLLDRELGPAVEATLYESITNGQLTVEALTIDDWGRVHELVLRYADLRLGGTDAGLIALAERHRQQRIATLNRRHFGVVRPAQPTRSRCCPNLSSSGRTATGWRIGMIRPLRPQARLAVRRRPVLLRESFEQLGEVGGDGWLGDVVVAGDLA